MNLNLVKNKTEPISKSEMDYVANRLESELYRQGVTKTEFAHHYLNCHPSAIHHSLRNANRQRRIFRKITEFVMNPVPVLPERRG